MQSIGKKVISTHDVIPLIRTELGLGRSVKLTVSGNSMLPWIAHNRDQVLLSVTDGSDLELGDIILFEDNHGRYKLHRIYKREMNGYRTIGDACLCEDGLVAPTSIIGVATIIYRKGKVIHCRSLPWKLLFDIWRKLLPIRSFLLDNYYWLRKLKRSFYRLRDIGRLKTWIKQ